MEVTASDAAPERQPRQVAARGRGPLAPDQPGEWRRPGADVATPAHRWAAWPASGSLGSPSGTPLASVSGFLRFPRLSARPNSAEHVRIILLRFRDLTRPDPN